MNHTIVKEAIGRLLIKIFNFPEIQAEELLSIGTEKIYRTNPAFIKAG